MAGERLGGDDAVELFLQPDPTRNDYFQFIGNSRGTIFDSRGLSHPEWNAKWDYSPWVGEGYWGGELSVTWGELGMKPPAPGTT